MHNKRIGRDDLLKIEVRLPPFKLLLADKRFSGLAHRLLLHGDLIPDVIGLVMTAMVVIAVVAAANAHRHAAVVDRPPLVAVTILHARMTAVTATAISMTAAAPEALMIATET
jgi:hypothetical protein